MLVPYQPDFVLLLLLLVALGIYLKNLGQQLRDPIANMTNKSDKYSVVRAFDEAHLTPKDRADACTEVPVQSDEPFSPGRISTPAPAPAPAEKSLSRPPCKRFVGDVGELHATVGFSQSTVDTEVEMVAPENAPNRLGLLHCALVSSSN